MWNRYKLIKSLSELKTFSVYEALNKKVQNGIILRHDVDWSLEDAYNLHLLEKKENIKSTYYIRLTSNLYNPLSVMNSEIIREMSKYHEIGLHFDSSIYEKKEINKGFECEINILSDIIQRNILTYSDHVPSHNGFFLHRNKKYLSAYDRLIFNPDLYISDSRYEYVKDLKSYLKLSNNNLIYLLTHPEYYFQKTRKYSKIVNRNTSLYEKYLIKDISFKNRNFKKFL